MKIPLIALFVIAAISADAQTLSPKLNQFLLSHPAAATTISNVVAEGSATVEIYYFYPKGEWVPRSTHRFLGDFSTLGVFIRENQQPSEECLAILFEVLNAKGEKRFMELFQQAKSGSISRADFVREMMLQEFQAVKATKKLIPALKLDANEIAASEYYQSLINSPDGPEKFLAYSKKLSQGWYPKDYEQLYEKIRQSPQHSTP